MSSLSIDGNEWTACSKRNEKIPRKANTCSGLLENGEKYEKDEENCIFLCYYWWKHFHLIKRLRKRYVFHSERAQQKQKDDDLFPSKNISWEEYKRWKMLEVAWGWWERSFLNLPLIVCFFKWIYWRKKLKLLYEFF